MTTANTPAEALPDPALEEARQRLIRMDADSECLRLAEAAWKAMLGKPMTRGVNTIHLAILDGMAWATAQHGRKDAGHGR